MIGKRFIDGDKLLERLQGANQYLDLKNSETARWLKRQPRAPKLVSRQGAAAILGIEPPHISRLKDRLPEPIEVEGSSWPVWLKSDIEALAKELKAERRNGHKAPKRRKTPTRST